MSLGSAEQECTVRIRNKEGLHARPAAEFVRVAARFDCDIKVHKVKDDDDDGSGPEYEGVNGKSILGVMMLAAECGSEITIRATGEDAGTAVRELAALVENRFGVE